MKRIITLCMLFALLSCSKQDLRTEIKQPPPSAPKNNKERKQPVIDDFGKNLKFEARQFTIPLFMASKNAGKGKGWGKGGNPKNHNNPDTPAVRATYVILLDFDGHTITNPFSEWFFWFNGVTQYSALTETAINTVITRFIEEFAPFDVDITTSEEVFQSYPVLNRTRVGFTQTAFLPAGGVAFIDSRAWGTDEPVYVFTSMLSYSGKFAGGAGVHEAGHHLGLGHQGDYRDGVKVSEYSYGITINRAPNMGVDYNDPDGGEWVEFPMFEGNWTIWSVLYDAHFNEMAYLKQPTILGIRKT